MAFKEENFNGKVVGNIQVSKHIKTNITQGKRRPSFLQVSHIYSRYTGKPYYESCIKESSRDL
jgi:hypothetical protein